MKQSNDVTFAKHRNPEVFDLDPVQGIRATSALAAELETLLSGVKKLRKSYVMKYVRSGNATLSVADHIAAGATLGMRRFSSVLADNLQPVPSAAPSADLPAQHIRLNVPDEPAKEPPAVARAYKLGDDAEYDEVFREIQAELAERKNNPEK